MEPKHKEDFQNTVDTEQNDINGNNPNQMNSGGAGDAGGNYGGNSGKNDNSAFNAPKGPNIFNIFIVVFLITSLINMFFMNRVSKSAQTIEYSQFLELVESGYADQVVLSETQLLVTIDEEADLAEVEKILYPAGKTENRLPSPKAGDGYIAVRVDDPDLVNRL
ncbi:MAG TPA: hypothetical protein GX704_03475, partial [Clostridiales bacterium]|nr:hypothetical protein [Clostridiales bacterium]